MGDRTGQPLVKGQPWLIHSINIRQKAGNRGITAENMEKLQHTDFNKDETNESASVACSHVRL